MYIYIYIHTYIYIYVYINRPLPSTPVLSRGVCSQVSFEAKGFHGRQVGVHLGDGSPNGRVSSTWDLPGKKGVHICLKKGEE